MRRFILIIVLSVSYIGNSQMTKGINGESNWLTNWTNFKPKTTEYRQTTQILSGVISQSTTLYKKNTYLLMGTVYVTKGATLSIEPGTIIRGDYESNGTLVITKGSKIIAIGEETDPIIFTSNKPNSERKPGDWGGIILFGEAITNKFAARLDLNLEGQYNMYGGKNDESSSGILKYVRIEFAGKKEKGFERDALTLAGVGSKTIIYNVQISFSNDESFAFYGGILNIDNLVSYKGMGTDFYFTEGTQCIMNNIIAIRNPFVSTPGKAKCFEVKSYDVASNVDLTKRLTNVIVNSATLLNEETENAGLNREAIFLSENCSFNINNSVVSGFNEGVVFDKSIKTNFESLDKIKIRSVLFNNCKIIVQSEVAEANQQIKNWYGNPRFKLEYSKIKSADFFIETDIKKNPDYRVKQSPIITTTLATN